MLCLHCLVEQLGSQSLPLVGHVVLKLINHVLHGKCHKLLKGTRTVGCQFPLQSFSKCSIRSWEEASLDLQTTNPDSQTTNERFHIFSAQHKMVLGFFRVFFLGADEESTRASFRNRWGLRILNPDQQKRLTHTEVDGWNPASKLTSWGIW